MKSRCLVARSFVSYQERVASLTCHMIGLNLPSESHLQTTDMESDPSVKILTFLFDNGKITRQLLSILLSDWWWDIQASRGVKGKIYYLISSRNFSSKIQKKTKDNFVPAQMSASRKVASTYRMLVLIHLHISLYLFPTLFCVFCYY